MSYRIGSLNISKRNHKSMDYGRDFFGFIYEVIADEGFVIFALQEVLKQAEVTRLLTNLPKWWRGFYGRPTAGTLGDYGFAYLWDTRFVVECSKQREPRIFTEYKQSVDLRMDRNPYYGRFTPEGYGPFYEFRLLNIHLRPGGIVQSRKECGLMTGLIHDAIDGRRYGNNRPAFTVVLGDYNYSCDDCNSITSEDGNPNVITIQKELTTLKKEEDGYASSYDHFSYNSIKHATVPYHVSRIEAVRKYFQGNYKKYKELVSDHVPIKLEIF